VPRYFFHIHDGISLPDDEGTILNDLEAARLEAILLTSALLRENSKDFWNGHEWKLDVADEHGLTLFTLMFIALDAPVLQKP